MGSYIELAGAERMHPRPGDLIVFPPERRHAKGGLRMSGRTLRQKYGITLSDSSMPYHTSSAVSERSVVNGLFHGRPDLPFCVVVNRVLVDNAPRVVMRANSFEAVANPYPGGVYAVTGYHVPHSNDADAAATAFANIMGSTNLGQTDVDNARRRIAPISPLAGGAWNAPSPAFSDCVLQIFDEIQKCDFLSRTTWVESNIRDIAGAPRLGDLLHIAANQWLDQTTRFPQLHQFTVPLKMLENGSVRVCRIAGSGLADAVLNESLARMTVQAVDICDEINKLEAVLKSTKDVLTAYGRKIAETRKPLTIRQAVESLAADISTLAAASAPAPEQSPETPATTFAQAVADAVRATALERRLA